MALFRLFWMHMFAGVSILILFGPASDASELFFGNKIPEKTPDPININSEKVQKVFTLLPLSLQANAIDKVTVINNGKTVEVIFDEFFSATRVTGGVLKGDYQFHKIKYLWTDDLAGVSGTTIDKKGYPLENIAVFFRRKYITFENALNYRDGLAVMDFFVDICPDNSSNVEFNDYYEVLQQVKEAGSIAQTTLGTVTKWFPDKILLSRSAYYAYPGSYFDEVTSKRYYCTTAIILQHLPQWCLSRQQYKGTFGSFKNSSGDPLTNSRSQFPRKQPVVQAREFINFTF